LRGGWPQEVAEKEQYYNLASKGENYKFRGGGYGHFFTSGELKTIFSNKGVNILEMAGLEGLNVDEKITNTFAKKFPDAWENWVKSHNRICTDPFVVDASGHMMIIVRKK